MSATAPDPAPTTSEDPAGVSSPAATAERTETAELPSAAAPTVDPSKS